MTELPKIFMFDFISGRASGSSAHQSA